MRESCQPVVGVVRPVRLLGWCAGNGRSTVPAGRGFVSVAGRSETGSLLRRHRLIDLLAAGADREEGPVGVPDELPDGARLILLAGSG